MARPPLRSRRRTLAGVATVVTLAAAAQAGYVVAPGDTLSAIAQRLGTTVRALADANGITDPDRIRAGDRLDVPTTGTPAAGAKGGPPAAAADRAEAGRILTEVSRRYGWNPAFVKAVAWQESGWQMLRTSSTGAVGIMQVMPGTGEFVSERLVGRSLDLSDPADNVTAGVAFLDHLYDLTGGDAEMTLAGYYQGLASVRRNGMYDDTRRYIANVLALKPRFARG